MAPRDNEFQEYNDQLEKLNKLAVESINNLRNTGAELRKTYSGDVAKNMSNMADSLQKQIEAVEKSDAWAKLNNSIKASHPLLANLLGGWKKAKKAAGEYFITLGAAMKALPKKLTFALGFVSGLTDSFNVMFTTWKVGWGIATKVVGTAWDGIKSVLSWGVGIIKSVVGFILDAWTQSGSTEFREQLREMKAEFGELNKGANALAIGMYKSFGRMRYQFRMNRAEALKYFAEIVKAGPQVFVPLTSQMQKYGREMFILGKGLGVSAEQMVFFGREAIATGEDIKHVMIRFAKYSGAYADAVEISTKQLVKGVMEAATDFQNFGNISTEELAKSEARLQSLGATLKDIAGIAGKFDTFRSAADSVSQLTAAFGVQINTMKLVRAENPAERVEMLKESFERAGKSAETMSRRELNLLSATSGLNQETAKLVFSSKNRGKSYDEIMRKAKASGKIQKSEKEVLQDLTKAIEKLIKSGSMKSFWQAMTEGASRAVRIWGRQTGAMYSYRRALRDVRRATRDFVLMILREFPGITKMAKGFAQLWRRENFLPFLRGIKNSFKEFLDTWKKDPKEAAIKLLKSLGQTFRNWFKTGGFGTIWQGAKEFGSAMKTVMAELFAQALKYAIESATSVLRKATKVLSEKGFGGLWEMLKDGATKHGSDFLGPIFKVLIESGPALWDAISNALGVMWDKFRETELWQTIKDWAYYSLAVGIGWAFAKGLLVMLGSKGLPWLFKGIGRKLQGLPWKEATVAGEKVGENISKGAQKGFFKDFKGGAGNFLKGATKLLGGMAMGAMIGYELGKMIADYLDKKGKELQAARNILSTANIQKFVGEQNKLTEKLKITWDNYYEGLTESERKSLMERGLLQEGFEKQAEIRKLKALASDAQAAIARKNLAMSGGMEEMTTWYEGGGLQEMMKINMELAKRGIKIEEVARMGTEAESFKKAIGAKFEELEQIKGQAAKITGDKGAEIVIARGLKAFKDAQNIIFKSVGMESPGERDKKMAAIKQAVSVGDYKEIMKNLDPEKTKELTEQVQAVLSGLKAKGGINKKELAAAGDMIKDMGKMAAFMSKVGDISRTITDAQDNIVSSAAINIDHVLAGVANTFSVLKSIAMNAGVMSIGAVVGKMPATVFTKVFKSLSAFVQGMENLKSLAGSNVADISNIMTTMATNSGEITSIFSALTGGSGSVVFKPGQGKVFISVGVNLSIDRKQLATELYNTGAVWAAPGPGVRPGGNYQEPLGFNASRNL